MRREVTNVAKQVETMKVERKRPRGRPRLRWMDRVQSDLKQHQLDPKLAQNREAVMVINPGQGYDWQRRALMKSLVESCIIKCAQDGCTLYYIMQINSGTEFFMYRTEHKPCRIEI